MQCPPIFSIIQWGKISKFFLSSHLVLLQEINKKSPTAEKTNRICYLIPFEENSNTLADETAQPLLWLHDPSGRKDAAVSFGEQKRTVNTTPDTLQTIHSAIIATVSLALL